MPPQWGSRRAAVERGGGRSTKTTAALDRHRRRRIVPMLRIECRVRSTVRRPAGPSEIANRAGGTCWPHQHFSLRRKSGFRDRCMNQVSLASSGQALWVQTATRHKAANLAHHKEPARLGPAGVDAGFEFAAVPMSKVVGPVHSCGNGGASARQPAKPCRRPHHKLASIH